MILSPAAGASRARTLSPVRIPVAVRRAALRGAYNGLRVYWYLARPEVQGVKCVLTKGEDVLLVRHTYGDRGWDLPGGRTRRDEAPVATARREMREELGVLIDDWKPLGEVIGTVDHRRDRMQCFHAELRDGRLRIDAGELDAVQWFPRRQLPDAVGRYVREILGRAAG
jgi:8-oxo-dGTP pyrophosphatase MutT (NUDIX family)